ncbi:SMP-30/gluconolactonase/LRE family protein [Ferviditalea candida]|uniref:SMP-30/gluconolactonase/LRE family protein n=1 Tax=Ferviditalea candida TaxID=3108399 RepID=A0ABU5ZEL6_9BACL|nr:SMP-30/gluconolactonase/LRE family protein [Paenibacillaceae bacterium T2]
MSVYSSGTKEFPAKYPNYPVFDNKGNLYYSDSGGDFYRAEGRIVVVRPDGATEHLYGGHLHFPNGMAIDAEEKNLYVIQSSASNILRFIDPYADRMNRPANVAFEPGSTRLFFANLGGFSVNAVDVGEKGLRLKYPKF